MSAFHSLIRLIDHSLYGFRVPYTTRPVFKYISLPTSPFLSHPVGLLLLLLAALGWRPGPDRPGPGARPRPSINSTQSLFFPDSFCAQLQRKSQRASAARPGSSLQHQGLPLKESNSPPRASLIQSGPKSWIGFNCPSDQSEIRTNLLDFDTEPGLLTTIRTLQAYLTRPRFLTQ